MQRVYCRVVGGCCPSGNGSYVGSCAFNCTDDSDCRGSQICCDVGCPGGSSCIQINNCSVSQFFTHIKDDCSYHRLI